MKIAKLMMAAVPSLLVASLTCTQARASDDFDWAAAAEAGGGLITITNGQTATVVDADIPAFANITKITCEGTTSRVYFKNTQPFTVNAEFAGPGKNENGPAAIQMDADTGKITFAKKVYFNDGRRIILGNADILAQFGAMRDKAYGPITLCTGCTADFKEGSSLTREYINYLYGAGVYKFACKIPTTSAAGYISVSDGGTFILNGDNLLNADYMTTGGGSFTIDMNGHPQNIRYLTGAYLITSATPATFTYNAYSTEDTTANLTFTGESAFTHASPKKTTLSSGISTTVGALSVTDGNLVINGSAIWKGGSVSVTGGKLTLGTSIALGPNVDVTVSGSGILEVPAGVACAANSLTINGNVIDISSPVSLTDLAQTYPNNVSGAGFIVKPITRYISLTGNDGADGKTEATAWRTFAFACAQTYPSGSRLVVLPGVYNEGSMSKSDLTGDFRLVVPDGLTIASRDGAATTIIEGKAATSSVWNGCGTDSLRCVYVGLSSRLEGFTLRGGRAYTNGTTKGDGGGVYAYGSGYNPGDAWIVDCVITNCASHMTGGASKYGKFLRCRILDCSTPSYASGIRCGAAYNCYFKGMSNTGSIDSGSGAPADVACVGNTFVGDTSAIRSFTGKVIDCLFVGTATPNQAACAANFVNCLFQTAPDFSPRASTNGACRVVTAAALALDAFGCPARTSVAVNTGIRADYEAAMPAGEDGKDGSGLSRYTFGGLDVGAYEYDPRADFSAALGDGVSVTEVTDNVVFGDGGVSVAIPSGEEMSLDWTLGRNPTTEYTFEVTLEAGAELDVFNHGTYVETVTVSKTVSFAADQAAEIRLVASGTGAAQVKTFLHDTVATIAAAQNGVELTGASFGVNYMTGEPITFTLKRKPDSSSVLSTGFTSNHVFYAWADYPDGWTYTVSDRASAIAVEAVYADPLNTWYVAKTGGDDDRHYGRLPEDAFVTIKKALTLAQSGDTVWVDDGAYDAGEMGDLFSANGGSRIVIPTGVTVRSVNGRAKTLIVGRKATTILSGDGCGKDSLRCAELKSNALLIGFTLTNGYSKTTTSTHDGGANGGGVLAASGAAVIDCTITKCVSANIGGVGQYGSYIGCRAVNCGAVNTYAKGIRDAELVCNCYLAKLGNGFTSSLAANRAFNSTFVFESGNAIFHNYAAGCHVYNCRFDSSADNVKPESCTYDRCLSLHGWYDAATLNDGSKTYADATELREAANENYLADVPEKFREWARTIDADGKPRIMNGQMDVGGTEYDIRPEFAHVLAADGTVVIDTIGPRTVLNAAGTGVTMADGETMKLAWAMPPLTATTFQFAADLADGASLAVFKDGVLLTTVTEPGKVTFAGTAAVSLRLVATGAVTVREFVNAVRAIIEAPKDGIAVEGAQVGVNYVEAGETLTFTVRCAYDAYEQYSTGFTSNGVVHAWEDYPNGFTYTVTDIDSSVSISAVYTEPGSLKDWYVSPEGSDTANFGRVPSNRMKTLAAVAKLATSGDTIHAASGTYDEGKTSFSTEADAIGYYRVVLPSGVVLESEEGAEKTFIVGAKAEPADARLALDGCGTNAVRGVYLTTGSKLRGFTVTGCYGRCYVDSKGETTGGYGGGIFSQSTGATASNVGRIYDCIVSNNYAWGGAGAHCGCFVRCQFLGNCSKLGYRIGFTGTPGYAINCYFSGQRTSGETAQSHVTDINAAINCTFMGDIGGIRQAGNPVNSYNCIFQTYPTTSNAGSGHFYNCLSTKLPTQHPETWTNAVRGNVVVPAAQLALDPVTHAPAAKDLATVDSDNAWNYYTNKVTSLVSEAEYLLDLNGGSRVYDARLDIGAAEYDWRGDFARCLSRRRCLGVTAASANVQTNGASLKLPEGTLAVTWSGKSGEVVTFAARQTGEGTLTVRSGDDVLVPVSSEGGVSLYRFKLTSDAAEFAFAFEGEGYVDLSGFRREIGLAVIVR